MQQCAALATWLLVLACGCVSCEGGDGGALRPTTGRDAQLDANRPAPADASPVADGSRRDAQLDAAPPDPTCPHPAVTAACSAGFCRIAAGCFVIGSPESEWGHPAVAEAQRNVTLTRAFEMQQHEVTQAQWVAAGLPNPSGSLPDGTGDCSEPECPVGNVTWSEAAAYANLLSERHDPPFSPCYELSGCQGEIGRGFGCSGFRTSSPSIYACEGYRLPTDAEREYAARAGAKSAFYSGPITEHATMDCMADAALQKIAWYCFNSQGHTHPVGQLDPNAWGLFDMAGNALEWVSDAYTGLPSEGATDPGATLKMLPANRVTRGGIFNGPAQYCRAAWQSSAAPGSRGPGLGFRLVRTLPDE